MLEQQVYALKEEEWVRGTDLWRVGFTLDALPLACLMDGLVEVLDCVWIHEDRALVFVVRNTDATDTLFKGGELCGVPIYQYRRPQQSLMVECPGYSKTRYPC